MTLLSADRDRSAAKYWLSLGLLIITVALRNAANGRTLATRNIAIWLHADVDETPAIGFYDPALGGEIRQTPRYASVNAPPRKASAIAPVGRDLSHATATDPTDDASAPDATAPDAAVRLQGEIAALAPRELSDRDAAGRDRLRRHRSGQ